MQEARVVRIAAQWCYLWAGLESRLGRQFARTELGVECTYWLLRHRFNWKVALTRWQRRYSQLLPWLSYIAGRGSLPVAEDGWTAGDDDSEDEDLWDEDEVRRHRLRLGL